MEIIGIDPPRSLVMSVSVEEKDPVYFNYYGQLQHQQNMLEDHVRTEAYYRAITENRDAFEGKVVLDVGTGTGILSFFAAQAGAKKVYAVEGSIAMARNAEILVEANGLSEVIKVIKGKIEDIELPEKVDVIISEPMGVLLFHERMIESFLFARNKFLKPELLGNRMSLFPGIGSISLAPFTDGLMYSDFKSRSKFWGNESFYGVNLSSMKKISEEQIFRQPVVGGFDPKTLMSESVKKSFEFYKKEVNEEVLKEILIQFEFLMEFTGVIHGLAGWFNVTFPKVDGTSFTLETGPENTRTHWQHCRFFFRKPIGVNHGQLFKGALKMKINEERSYNVVIEGKVNDVKVMEAFALHEQQYFNLSPTEYPELSSECYNLY